MTEPRPSIDPDAGGLASTLAGERPRWLQIECELCPTLGGPCLPGPWQALSEALRGWRGEGRFQRFSFLRKSPGLRLRFSGRALDTELAPVLLAWLERSSASGAIHGFRRSSYEPEVHRFGGPDGMAVADLLFDRDSELLVRQETLRAVDGGGLAPPAEVSLAIVSDLVSRCVDDGAEAWDVWMRLRDALGMASEGSASAISERDRGAAALAPIWLEALPGKQRELMDCWMDAHTEVARALQAAEDSGVLATGRRRWLASACVFHWNRAGLDFEGVRATLASLVELWRPPEQRS
jgi:thiopeptide-type bacteriocin biosynthesis protein